VDAIRAGTIHVVINTTQGTKAIRDSYAIRRGALLANVPYFTTMSAALAAVSSLEAWALGGGVLLVALYVAIGGHPAQWFHPPVTSEQVAALVVFPLGEEFGWRGFAQPRMARRHGPVKGSLLVGLAWGLWHLMYSITPQAGGFDPLEFGLIMVELPLYSLLIAWVFERADRSMAVAIAFHAGAHLDHIERAPRTDLRLHLLHLTVLAAFAGAAAWSLSRRAARTSVVEAA